MNSTAGQGGITTKFAGRTVFHISSGKRKGSDGCSAFFTLSTDGGGGTLTAGAGATPVLRMVTAGPLGSGGGTGGNDFRGNSGIVVEDVRVGGTTNGDGYLDCDGDGTTDPNTYSGQGPM